MASSDDEVEDVPKSVSEYYFVDEKEEPISFSVLPVRWGEGESVDGNQRPRQVFLNGKADNGLKKVYKQVTAWKFDLSNAYLEIYVLTKDNCWIKIFKPRKSYEEIIRTVLITLHCLHFVRRNPETSARSVWDHLSRVFSSYDARPSQDDLLDHIEFINVALKMDSSLSNCKFLLAFLEERPQRRMLPNENVRTSTSGFIVDDLDDFPEDVEEDESKEDDELFDSVCAFCDNGGDILCCEGRCMRAFHATVESGEESVCQSLGFTDQEVEAMQNFFCMNCEYKQHQCFACGELGNSDRTSGAKVFQCANATCGYFYHPHCVARLLHREDKVAAEKLCENITSGETFACPIHKCCICKQVEDKKKPDLQFAVCRRCPTAYHRKCLPREIAFDDIEDEGIMTRAWENLLPNRILIYCLKHVIDEEIGTPKRDHIIFPGNEDNRRAVAEKKRRQMSESEEDIIPLKKKKRIIEEPGKTVDKMSKKLYPVSKMVKVTSKNERMSSEQESLRKMRVNADYKNSSREDAKSGLKKVDRSATAKTNRSSLGEQLFDLVVQKSGQVKQGSKVDKTNDPSTKKLSSGLPSLDPESERRLVALVKEVASAVSFKDIVKKLDIPSTHVYSSKYVIDKNVTLGKVEGAVEAVKLALKKLDQGGSIEDAKAVCEPEVLYQIFRWKNKLKVHLAPFLHGMRYTSFGRHFTKVEKLQELVAMLHWYVQEGDMIVDFCCGANDFSCLMKKKLEEKGKQCLYKNYDLFQPKNDFSFEKRDWMTVRPQELPQGDRLIMGLNPPFGVKAALANKFIDQALKFKPKLLVLIVPPETERLDQKAHPYDLVWEDNQFLAGKSFYIPGSVDENEKQIDQWNLIAPPLYLWSRPDWSTKHMAIAQEHGHRSFQQERVNLKKESQETLTNGGLVEGIVHKVDSWMSINDFPTQDRELEASKCEINVDEDNKGNSSYADGDRGSQNSHGRGKSQSSETTQTKRVSEGQHGSRVSDKSPDRQNGQKRVSEGQHGSRVSDKSPDRQNGQKRVSEGQHGSRVSDKSPNRQNGQKPFPNDTYNSSSRHRPSNVVSSRSSRERLASSSPKIIDRHPLPSNAEVREIGFQHPQTSMPGLRAEYRVPYGWNSGSADVNRTYNISSDESYHRSMHGFSRAAMGQMRDPAEDIRYRPSVMESFDPVYGQRGPLPSTPYSHLGAAAAAGSTYGMNSMSAMQRYAPRLDELNHARMDNLGPEPPMFHGNGFYDPRAPGPRMHRPGSMGFSPGPRHPYSRGSAGWLNE